MTDYRPLHNNGRFQPNQISGNTFSSTSGYGALRVAQLEPEGMELTRAGRRFNIAVSAAVTGIAPVQAIPTTAAQWALFNTSTTDSLLIESVGMMLVSGTAGAGIVVWGAIFSLPAQTGLATGAQLQNANGGTRASACALKSAVTVTSPAAPSWFPLAKSDTANTAVLSVAAISHDLKGRLIIPPLKGLALATLSPAGTSPLYFPTCSWTEGQLDLE